MNWDPFYWHWLTTGLCSQWSLGIDDQFIPSNYYHSHDQMREKNHVSQSLSSHGRYQIITWSHHYLSCGSNMFIFFKKTWIMCQFMKCRILLPWLVFYYRWLTEKLTLHYLPCFSCDQAPLWMVFSVRLSVCHTFLTMSIIRKFSEVITNDQIKAIFRSYYQWPN